MPPTPRPVRPVSFFATVISRSGTSISFAESTMRQHVCYGNYVVRCQCGFFPSILTVRRATDPASRGRIRRSKIVPAPCLAPKWVFGLACSMSDARPCSQSEWHPPCRPSDYHGSLQILLCLKNTQRSGKDSYSRHGAVLSHWSRVSAFVSSGCVS